MKNKFIFTILFTTIILIYSEGVQSQTTEIKVIDSTSAKPNKWKFGVGFGLSFIGGTNISLAPNITYQANEKISFGGGVQGSYTALKDIQNTTTIGGNVIFQYTPIKMLTALLEFAELNVSTETETPTGKMKNNYWDAALFLGAGMNVTEKITIGAKYNVLYNEDESVYTSPILPFVNISF
ncbi:alpha-ketoglutarate decarboxylase [Aureisphaera sp. CAU 1614]|uniref:Alpha-ketoglutarate decarboxylase n=1 Tax=Halomarinibacterium sedimenti TaxID=2857106 RepID=A0A9X1JYS4_9FLAO|nr:alpha-ketoglutarate decarboxylase [Halomarinibacterium sedimenti]MBW2937817.1 alpha-ketoglutarate decarboxylase [Halomarinibacterium sedimenti]